MTLAGEGLGRVSGKRSAKGGDRPRSPHRPPLRAPEPWELDLLRLLVEQLALPFDQLGRFLACEPEQVLSLARHLSEAGYADHGRTLMGEPPWLWPTWRGSRLSGLGFPAAPPRIGAMARIRAVNEVRLLIARRAPQARWLCGRRIIRERGQRGARPNAVVEIDDERHAILVRSGCARDRESERRVAEELMARHDALIVFCARRGTSTSNRPSTARSRSRSSAGRCSRAPETPWSSKTRSSATKSPRSEASSCSAAVWLSIVCSRRCRSEDTRA